MLESPYIPLSWLREKKVWARKFFENGDNLDEHDLWLFNVRFEMQRIIIQELREKIVLLKQENEELHGKMFAMNEGYRYDSECDYRYQD